MRFHRALMLAAGTTLFTVWSAPVAAQAPDAPFVAPFLGYNVDGTEALLGATVGIPIRLGTTALTLSPGLETYPFVDAGSFYSLTLDVHYGIPTTSAHLSPYVGGGLLVNRSSFELLGQSRSTTNSQLNAIGGLAFRGDRVRPFVEANVRLLESSTMVLKAGGRIKLGS